MSNRRIGILVLAALFMPAVSLGANMDEARQFVERTATLRCELIDLQYQLQGTPTESPAHNEVAAKLYKRAAEVQRELGPGMQRFESTQSELTGEQLQLLARHAMAITEACAKQATDDLRARIQAGTAVAPGPRAKVVVPYTPPATREKSLRQGDATGALQAQQPIGQ